MIEKLLEYQKVDAGLKNIETELKSSEEFKKWAQAVKFLKTVSESKAQIEARAKALLSKMADFNASLDKLNEDKNEFEGAENSTEESTVNFLKKKSVELSKQFSVLEAEVNKLSQEMTELAQQYKKLMANTKAMLAQQDEFKAKYEELVKSKEAEKAVIKKQLDEIAKDIPKEYLEKYLEKRKDNKFPIVYELNGTHCSACGTELSQLELAKLKAAGIRECENCRRLIFIKD